MTDQLVLSVARISEKAGDGAVDFKQVKGEVVWTLKRKLDADGVTIARILGCVVPNPLDPKEHYHLPIPIPHPQPLAGFAHVQTRLGKRNRFTNPTLFYAPVDGGNEKPKVMLTIHKDGLVVYYDHCTFDSILAGTVAWVIARELGPCTTTVKGMGRGNRLFVTLEPPPALCNYDRLLDTCHRVAEIVYAAQ